MNHIINIWGKELMDSLRDKKSLRQALIIPLILGIFYAIINPMFGSIFEQRAREPITIPAQGIEYAGQDFLDMLARFDITLEPYDGDLAAVVTQGKEAAGLIIPPGFSADVSAEKAASLTLITNQTSGGMFGASFSGERLELAISAYSQQVVAQRLQARGIDVSLISPVSLQTKDLATPAQLGGLFASFTLPILIVLIVAQGGLFIAIDVTAGEKERGTLEALLVTPATDIQVMIGKLLAVFTLSTVPLIITLAGFWIASRLLPETMRMGGELPLAVILVAILVGIPLALLMAVILMMISVRTKTFKDAQSAAAPLSLGALIPAFAAAFVPPQAALAYLIPMYGPAALVSQTAINGGQIDGLALALSIIGSLIAAAVALVLAMRLFNRERLLYAA